jgi:hypothetical protein
MMEGHLELFKRPGGFIVIPSKKDKYLPALPADVKKYRKPTGWIVCGG